MTTPQRGLGRRFFEDKRDNQFTLFAPASHRATKHTERYWRDTRWWGDQGRTPHCVGYAWAHWLINSPILNFVNPDGIYALATLVDEWDDDGEQGTSVRAGAKILHRLGLISSYLWCWDIDSLTTAVLDRGPVVVGTEWTEGMCATDKKHFIHATGKSVGGHAYIINGYSTKYKRFRIKNSWGREWGNSGRAYISKDDMATLIARQGEVCLAIEQQAIPPYQKP